MPPHWIFIKMERKTGFEPATLALARRCSTTELFPQKTWCRDPELNWGHVDFQSTALPTELSRHLKSPYIILLLWKWRGRRDLNSRSPAWQAGVLNQAALRPHYNFIKNGRRNRAWTCDPWLVKPVLSQLSYPPTYYFYQLILFLSRKYWFTYYAKRGA